MGGRFSLFMRSLFMCCIFEINGMPNVARTTPLRKIEKMIDFYIFCKMDELGFYVPSTVFQSFRDDGRVNMKGSVQ